MSSKNTKKSSEPAVNKELRQRRCVAVANVALAERKFEILEFRFVERGASGHPQVKTFPAPGNYAVWEPNGAIIPIVIYMNRGKPARMPKFPHYLLQVNSEAAATPGVVRKTKDAEWVKRNIRLFRTKDNAGDLSYEEVTL